MLALAEAMRADCGGGMLFRGAKRTGIGRLLFEYLR